MYQRILVPVDGSATSNAGLDEAIKLAKLTGAGLRLIHMVDEFVYAAGFETFPVDTADLIGAMKESGSKILEAAKARVVAAGVKVEAELIEGMALRLADVVVQQAGAWKADLVVIGTHGRRGVGRLLLGSDAEQVLRNATVPVLLVRAEGAVPNSSASESVPSAVREEVVSP
jgi:nucleotide-binding universal stress UspA family protein